MAAERLAEGGLRAAFPIVSGPMSLPDAMRDGRHIAHAGRGPCRAAIVPLPVINALWQKIGALSLKGTVGKTHPAQKRCQGWVRTWIMGSIAHDLLILDLCRANLPVFFQQPRILKTRSEVRGVLLKSFHQMALGIVALCNPLQLGGG